MPTTATVANIASAAPPSTGGGMLATIAPALGISPMMIMITPAVATTQRLLTPGQPDQADVLGEAGVGEGVQHAAEDGRQAVGPQRPGDVLWPTRFSTISPVAKTSPVVSTAVISMTTIIEMIAAMENFGMPK